jgi:hypothetical protein
MRGGVTVGDIGIVDGGFLVPPVLGGGMLPLIGVGFVEFWPGGEDNVTEGGPDGPEAAPDGAGSIVVAGPE